MTSPSGPAQSNPSTASTAERRRHALSVLPPVAVSDGELVPAVLTIDLGHTVHLDVPLGAFASAEGKPCFVSAVDLVGLLAATLGIGVGALGVLMTPKMIRAVGVAARRRSS